MPMVLQDAYEVLDALASKSGMFAMIKDEMIRLKTENEALKTQQDELTLMMGDLLLGGM